MLMSISMQMHLLMAIAAWAPIGLMNDDAVMRG
jgi:hypothetical protein